MPRLEMQVAIFRDLPDTYAITYVRIPDAGIFVPS